LKQLEMTMDNIDRPYRHDSTPTIRRQAEALIPTPWGRFNMIAYADGDQEMMPHLALVHEDFKKGQPIFLRIHSECMTGDLFGSRRCDCGDQLDAAMRMTAEKGGVVIYLRQEGRGIGLINKLKAYNLQDEGLNTLDANTHLGLEVDSRAYGLAIEIMQDLGIESIHLLTNNPEKVLAIKGSPIKILSRVPLVVPPHADNEAYLNAKKQFMGHLLE
jgi:GTP cyclohydrolase II